MNPLQSRAKLRFLSLILLLVPFRASQAAPPGELNVRVSEAAQQIMQFAKPVFAKARSGTVVHAKVEPTAQVIEDLAKNEVPVGFITRNVRAHDLELAPDLVGTPVGLDAIVMALPSSNPVTNLSVDQIRAIWTRDIVNWQEIGGPDLAIVIIGRPKAYDLIQLFGDFIKLDAKPVEGGLVYREKGQAAWGTTVASAPVTDDLALTMLRATPGAITYFPVEILRRYQARGLPVKGLTMNGVEPTPAMIANGQYFIHRTVNVVTRGAPVGAGKAFADFLLSREGQQLVIDSGFLAYTP